MNDALDFLGIKDKLNPYDKVGVVWTKKVNKVDNIETTNCICCGVQNKIENDIYSIKWPYGHNYMIGIFCGECFNNNSDKIISIIKRHK